MKKNQMIRLLCLLFIASLPMLSIAQDQNVKSPKGNGERKKQIKEKIESQRVAFITKELDLTAEEAKAFWPVYNEYEAKKEALATEFRDANKSMKGKTTDEMTNEEIEATLNNGFVHAQKILDLRKEYVAKFKKVLPLKKVAKLMHAEKEFKQELVKKVKDHRKGRGRKMDHDED